MCLVGKKWYVWLVATLLDPMCSLSSFIWAQTSHMLIYAHEHMRAHFICHFNYKAYLTLLLVWKWPNGHVIVQEFIWQLSKYFWSRFDHKFKMTKICFIGVEDNYWTWWGEIRWQTDRVGHGSSLEFIWEFSKYF